MSPITSKNSFRASNDWLYSCQIDEVSGILNFNISNSASKPKPEFLFRYYQLNKNGTKGLLKNYLYANHPLEFNDPFDCYPDLIDFSNITFKRVQKVLSSYFPKKLIKEEYFHNKEISIRKFRDFYTNVFSAFFGVVCLTDIVDNMLMWSYYSQHRGFAIKYKVDVLPKEFFGPFPINYWDNPNPLDFEKYEELAFVYQTNIKSTKWIHEQEWRLLVFNGKPMTIPGRTYIGIEAAKRKFQLKENCIQEVILGSRFFEYPELESTNNKDEFIVSFDKSKKDTELKSMILDHILQNQNIKVSMIHLVDSLTFKLKNFPIQIEKINQRKYHYKRI